MTDTDVLRRALVTIKKLKKSLQENEKQQNDPIAIVGLACRFPTAMNPESYWKLLSEGNNVISRFPEARLDLLKGTHEKVEEHFPCYGGFLENIDTFDADFFKISPREAIRMDPQQRILLEVVQEAIDDAGLSSEKLKCTNTGVFTSLYASPFGHLQKVSDDRDALYLPTGNAVSMSSNRISYYFDLQGPSIALDTACSSSLVSIHLASLYLQNKLCHTAIVGAVNINLFPSINFLLSKAKMLSPDGQCYTFDARANGYVQGEGAGAIILKPLKNALENGDCIYAVIAGSGINQDGKTNGLTAPNGLQQEKLLKEVYQAAGIDPKHISYLECHGTGTFLGDPIEVEALGKMISKEREKNNSCWIGSVKTNLGHLEPAAGIASVIKVALALQHKKIPPHLHFSIPNPHIDFEKYHFQIPTQLQDWISCDAGRIAGVSGFGFGGTNAHLILREANEQNTLLPKKSRRVWNRKKYWPEWNVREPILYPHSVLHPLSGKKIDSPLSEIQFEFLFSTKMLPEIRDTYHIVHVGYYLEMLALSVEKQFQKEAFRLLYMDFSSPILVSEQEESTVQLVLKKVLENHSLSFSEDEAAPAYHFYFYTLSKDKKNWVKHAEGQLVLSPIQNKKINQQERDAIKNSTIEEEADHFYHRILSMGMPAGESIRWTKRYWKNEKEILCEFQTPQGVKNKKFTLALHPGVGDACVQALFLPLPIEIDQAYVVSHIENMSYQKGDVSHLFFLGAIDEIYPKQEKFIGNWKLINQNGDVILGCEKMVMTRLNNKNIKIENIMKGASVDRIDLSVMTRGERKNYLIHFLSEQVSSILLVNKENIQVEASLYDMGMDSLMWLVLAKAIEVQLGLTFSIPSLSENNSIKKLSDSLLDQVKVEAISSPWIAYRKKQMLPQCKLFCFPYGGSGASLYREWQALFPDTIEICPIQLPGRENRMNENPIKHINRLIETVEKETRSERDIPFAFFGHSFGSLVAFELARYLRRHHFPEPQHLFVAGFSDPKIPTQGLDRIIQQLKTVALDLPCFESTDAVSLLNEEQLKKLSDIFSEHRLINTMIKKEALKLLLPVFSGDMAIVKSYEYDDEPPFLFPITAFSGEKDTWISHQDHLGWADHTQATFEIHSFDSGHLFINDEKIRKQVTEKIVGNLLQ